MLPVQYGSHGLSTPVTADAQASKVVSGDSLVTGWPYLRLHGAEAQLPCAIDTIECVRGRVV